MKCIMNQPKLQRGLTIVGHAVPSRAMLPIERYILATTESGRVRLSARREDIGIHYWVEAETLEEGVALLPAHLLSDFVRNAPASSITLTSPSPQHADACNIRCLRSSADMKNASDDPAEFTLPPVFTDGGELLMQMDAALLKEVIAQTAFAAAHQEGSWSWTVGVRIEIEAGKAFFTATDSFRFAMYALPVPDDQLRCHLLVSAKTLQELARLLPEEGTASVLLTPGRNMVLFHIERAGESIDLSTRLLSSENYHDLRQALPTAWSTRAVINRQELIASIKLMLPYARENQHKLQCTFFGEHTQREINTVSLETVAADVGTIEDTIAAQVQGRDQHMILNIEYLLEALEALDTAQVALEMSESNHPVALKPIGPGEYVYIMMPISSQQPASASASASTSAQENRSETVPVS